MAYRPLISLLFVSLALPGCCDDCCTGDACNDALDTDAAPVAVTGDSEEGSAAGAEPVSEFEEAREREAVRGLEFEGGRVRIDAAEAREIVPAPDRAAAETAFAEGLDHLGRNEILDAIRCHTRAVLLAPDAAQMYVGLGDAIVREEGWESRAAAVYRTALDLEPESAMLWARYADASWRTGDVTNAMDAWKKAIEIDPKGAEPFVRLGNIAFLEGKDAEAWQYVHEAEARGGTVPPQMRAMLAARAKEPVR
jgi:tetratricopeptide (TPR) repeat protein